MVETRPSYRYQLAIGALTILMVATLLGSLAEFWRMGSPATELLVYASLSTAIAWLIWYKPGVAIPALLSGLALGLVVATLKPEWGGFVNALREQGAEFWDHMRALEFESAFGRQLGQVFLLLTAIGGGLLIIGEALGRGRAFWAITGGTVVLGTQWAWFFEKSGTYFMIYLVLSFLLWVLANAARRDARWVQDGRRIRERTNLITALAGVVMVGICATVLPTDFAPIDVGAMGDKMQEAFPILKHMRGGFETGSGRFRLLSTGFSPSVGALGGPVKLDNTVALHLELSQPLSQSLYLRGITLPEYSGKSWLDSTKNFKPMVGGETVASQYADGALTETVTFTVIPALNMGDTIFSALEPIRISGLTSNYKVDADGNLVADKSIAKGTRYEVMARTARYSTDQIHGMAKATTESPEPAYLQVPATLPKRVGEMARTITKGQKTAFDQAVTLESYLRAMRYDLNVPSTPTGRDFVDYFLFDLKRGYCTYYASAMVVMLRELGIPARFVEGFAVGPTTQHTENANGKHTYAVLNSQAHAWVEAYISGYGWVTFEPTPRDDLPLIDRTTPLPGGGDPTSGTDPGQSANPPTEGDPGRDKAQAEIDVGADAGASGRATKPWYLRPWVWAVGGLALLAGAAFVTLRRLTAVEELKTSQASDVVQEAWTRTAVVMDRFDFGRKPGQTAQEYAQTLSKAWPGLRASAQQVADDYTLARYGPDDRPLDPEAPARAQGLWSGVQRMLLERYGWKIYVWRRLRFRKRPGDFAD